MQSGSLSFTPADDAHIFNANPSNNYGSATTLQVDDSPVKHFLIKFDVTGINSQQVTNAKLCLYNVDGASAGGDFHHVNDDSWQEETVTWNNAPTADTQVLASLGSVSANTWYEVNLTTLITGDGTYSLRVSDSAGGADYSSKEGTNAPKLLIALAGAAPQSCSTTATATPTNTPTPGPSPTPTNTSAPTSTPTATQPPQGAFNSATFVYDGDGKRVKSTFNGTTTTYFVGNHYEVTGSTITKYYYAGAQRIAMRTNSIVNYLLGDHLGSTSLTTNATGQIVSEVRYKAWGETRFASGTMPTKYTYTGQYSDSYINLLWYGSRHYDPELGRFIQPDSIVPGPNNPQAWDRYAYTFNNPVRYVDPDGHFPILPLLVVIGAIVLSADTPSLGPGDAAYVGDLVVAGIQHEGHANIVGAGLQSLQDDPSVQSAQDEIVTLITNQPGYGEQAFTVSDGNQILTQPFTAEGPSGNWIQAAIEGNQAFWMVRNGDISATNTTVSADGTISTTWHIHDDFDFIPGPNRSKEYNFFAAIIHFPYHDLLGAESFPTDAYWNEIIPPREKKSSPK